MFKSFLQKQTQRWSVGLDIGTDSVKLICLAPHQEQKQLMAHATFARNDVGSIKEALRQSAIKDSDLRVSIQDPSMKIKKLDLPDVPVDEVEEVIRWGMKDAVGGDQSIEKYVFRHLSLSAQMEQKLKPYLVFGLEADKIAERQSEVRKLGVGRIDILEPHIHALANSVQHSLKPENNQRVAVVDFGKSLPVFLVVSSEGLLFARNLNGVSGEALTMQICRTLQISFDEAEKIKMGSGQNERNEKIPQETTRQFLSRVAIEIQNSLDSFMLQSQQFPVSQILVTGKGARFHYLREHLHDTLKIPTHFLNPFQNLDTSRFGAPEMEEIALNYGVALGLAL